MRTAFVVNGKRIEVRCFNSLAALARFLRRQERVTR